MYTTVRAKCTCACVSCTVLALSSIIILFRQFILFYTLTVLQEILLVGVENSMAQKLLDTSDVTSRLKHLSLFLEEQNSTLQSQNELINRSELEISRCNGLIERKQTQIDQMNKKIEQQMSKQGVR